MRAATIRGRLLFLSLSSRCGYYLRAVTIRGVASIRINTVIIIFTGPGGSGTSGIHMCPPLAGHLDYTRQQGLPVPYQPIGMKFTN